MSTHPEIRRRPARRPERASGRRGNVLVEFALVAFGFYLLLAGTFELGRMILASQGLQAAARVGARELALVPLPALATFDEALSEPRVLREVYDPSLLALDVTGMDAAAVDAVVAGWPALNRALLPLMFREHVQVDGSPRELLRYPGALFRAPGGGPSFAGEYLVAVPRVVAGGGGGETIEWLPVVEEVRPADPEAAPFSLDSSGPLRGMVALRLHYPFQAATLSSFRGANEPVLAADGGVSAVNAPPGAAVALSGGSEVYGGPYSLGRLYALGEEVRPYRRLLTAQALFRREVFTE